MSHDELGPFIEDFIEKARSNLPEGFETDDFIEELRIRIQDSLNAKIQEKPTENKVPCLQCDSCKAMQQANHPDFIEIDAASHTGVENVRQILENCSYMPILGSKKIYLIDEAHMLSKAAFNAVLLDLYIYSPPSIFSAILPNILLIATTIFRLLLAICFMKARVNKTGATALTSNTLSQSAASKVARVVPFGPKTPALLIKTSIVSSFNLAERLDIWLALVTSSSKMFNLFC